METHDAPDAPEDEMDLAEALADLCYDAALDSASQDDVAELCDATAELYALQDEPEDDVEWFDEEEDNEDE